MGGQPPELLTSCGVHDVKFSLCFWLRRGHFLPSLTPLDHQNYHSTHRWQRVCVAAGDFLVRLSGGVGQIGGFSHESEHDLAMMVSDFLENGSVGAESCCSSDSDSGFSDLAFLPEKFRFTSIQWIGPCNTSCIRFCLVKRLRLSGYDAAVCSSRWQGCGKVPGARAVESYDRILSSLPVIYVGSLTKLKQFLQVMVEAARSSLKQNSMPLPPWRSLDYLEAKWQSSYQRQFNPDGESIKTAFLLTISSAVNI
ncbi:hypothetical protein CK203_010237 [Vitis vinifera]|uniref:Uncharacterized protein n=1 Tax=Vitis vinifera TaxID=29760 RepID=A0A438JXQ7_VITVI|nr:hypothetical protein CK203_010237 [Vitis vinifera]